MKTLTVTETATVLRSTRSAVRKAIARGTLAATLVDGTYVVALDEVERYDREHRTTRLADRVAPETETERRAAWGDR